MTNEATRLAACPFCGGAAHCHDYRGGAGYWQVECQDCDATTDGCRIKSDAIEAWNRRATLAQPAVSEEAERVRAVVALQSNALHLTEEGRDMATVTGGAAVALKPSEVNHLRRLLGWVACEVGQSPDEMVQGVRELAAKGLQTDEAGKARFLQAHQSASNVPKYIRAAIKSLAAAMASQEKPHD